MTSTNSYFVGITWFLSVSPFIVFLICVYFVSLFQIIYTLIVDFSLSFLLPLPRYKLLYKSFPKRFLLFFIICLTRRLECVLFTFLKTVVVYGIRLMIFYLCFYFNSFISNLLHMWKFFRCHFDCSIVKFSTLPFLLRYITVNKNYSFPIDWYIFKSRSLLEEVFTSPFFLYKSPLVIF